MQLTICHPVTSAVRADALFASVLQRSDNPSAGQVRKAIAGAVRASCSPHRRHLRSRACVDSPDRPWPASRRGGWPGDEAHPRRQAEDPTRARLDGGPAGRPAGPRCGPGQGAGPCPADRLVPASHAQQADTPGPGTGPTGR
jgi:hypothetical protein